MLRRFRDPVSGLMHLVAAILSVGALAWLLWVAIRQGSIWQIVSFAVFGMSLILLYTSSAIYHLVKASARVIQNLRRLDHTMIFVLIAGTYTPFCLGPLRGPWGFWLLGVIWGVAVLGILFSIFWIDAPRCLSTSLYLAMGWAIVFAAAPLVRSLPGGALIWLAIGGLMYSLGALIYATKRPNPVPGVFGFHEIWHLFVMAGSFSHFVSVLRYLPALG